jgi:hypothetical protein
MKALGWLIVGVAGIATGVAATRPVVRWLIERSMIHDGPWLTSATTGSAAGGPYERAAVAIAGLYALSKEETVYYTAYSDDDGRPLDGACDYVVLGAKLPARWWSLTLYGPDDFLVANSAHVYSRHAANLAFDDGGRFTVRVSAHDQEKNWLPSPASGGYSLTLRLYNPQPQLVAHLESAQLPSIGRERCR